MLNAILLFIAWILLTIVSVRSIKKSNYINELEEELRSTVSNHNKYVDDKTKIIKNLQKDYKDVSDQKDSLEKENKKLREENIDILKKVSDLWKYVLWEHFSEKEINLMNIEWKLFSAIKKELRSDLNTFKEKIKTLNITIDNRTIEVHNLKSEKRELKLELTKTRNKVKASKIKEKDKKINALKQTIIRRDRRIKNLLNKKK